jgi:hypothetical protein
MKESTLEEIEEKSDDEEEKFISKTSILFNFRPSQRDYGREV